MLSCQSNLVFEDYRDTQKGKWLYDSVVIFQIPIHEPDSYQISYRIRNSISYPFANLYVQYEWRQGLTLKDSGIHECFLMEQKTGQPLGKGVGEYYDHEIKLFTQFVDTGNYTLKIRQYMRLDTLEGIVAVGATLRQMTNP